MEREGEGREGEKMRRGSEKKRGRRGIIVGGMILGLLMGCNNGGEDPQKVFLKSVVSLGSNFLDVFTSFGDMIGGVLGFNAETKKSAVGDYFKQVKETVEGAKNKLNTMVADMKEKGNPNASSAEGVLKKLVSETLDPIAQGAKTVSEAIGNDTSLIADLGSDGAGVASDTNVVKSITEGIKKISGIVLKEKGQADAGDEKNPGEDGSAGQARTDTNANTNNGALALFAKQAIGDSNPGVGKAAKDASKAVGAVSGADILKAISEGESGNAAKLALHNAQLSGGNPIAASNAKDAVIAGGMALRAMAKGGKFANKTAGGGEEAEKQIQNAAVSAVTKALNTLTIAIRQTIDAGLKEVKEAMKINPEDTPVISEASTANNK